MDRAHNFAIWAQDPLSILWQRVLIFQKEQVLPLSPAGYSTSDYGEPVDA